MSKYPPVVAAMSILHKIVSEVSTYLYYIHTVQIFTLIYSALQLLEGVWFNTHGLPNGVCVFEIRVIEGYGARWYITKKDPKGGDANETSPVLSGSHNGPGAEGCLVKARIANLFSENLEVAFRGFLEPHAKDGHENKWRH